MCSNPFIEMWLARVLALLLFYMDMTSPETIEIGRFMPQNKQNKWKEGIDTFTLPESGCNQTESRYVDCKNLCKLVESAGRRYFQCSCSDSKPTLTYYNSQWICQEKGQVRSQFDCGVSTLFRNEGDEDRLRMLNTIGQRRTDLNKQNCSVNVNNSWYIGCYGEKVPLKQNAKLFYLERRQVRFNKFAYYIQVLNDSSLRGRIINLGINCTAGSYSAGCLVFKLEGKFSCRIKKPPLPGLQSSTVPTASLSSSIITTTATPSSAAPATPTKAIKEEQKHEDTSSSSSLGIIAGVTASIATVVFVIAVVVFYRRRKSRKGGHASTAEPFKKNPSGGNSKENEAFQPEAQYDYLINRNKEPRTSHAGDVYAALNVPEGHNIYGPQNVNEPFYNVLQDPALDKKEKGQRNGSLSLDPAMYHTLEKLPVEGPGNGEHSCPTEPMYNVLEGPTPGVREETERSGATSVSEPFYNTVEKPTTNEGLPGGNRDPVYNILEDRLCVDSGSGEQYGPIGLQDPVYNVLEGPDDDVMERNVSKDNRMPVYAGVNKKKK